MKFFRASLSMIALCTGFFPVGCSSSPTSKPSHMESTIARVCQKVDECNFLPRGVSASDCEDATQTCVSDEVKSARDDWYMVLDDCLQFANCENFEKCARKIDYCAFDSISADGGAAGSRAPEDAGQGVLRAGLIQFAPMYSAFDGEHTFQVTPSVPSAASSSTEADPVEESSLQWQLDADFVKAEAFAELPGAILLTTKKPGATVVKVSGTTRSGVKVRGEAQLTISKADPGEWAKGDARYSAGMMINLAGGPSASGMSWCGLPIDLSNSVPSNSACSNCHSNMNGLAFEPTPTQTAGYSNDELIEIFTNARKPAGGKFTSPFLKNTPMPDCIYKALHTWQLDDDTKLGIVWKLRSLAPRKQEDVDLARLGAAASGAKP